MQKHDIKIRSSTEGREFDCYIVTPSSNNIGDKVPAVVLASAVHGVNGDIRAIAEEFAARGYLAAAPDLFWRTVPGPLARDDGRLRTRSQPRLEVIRKGETDMVDTLSELKKYPQFNGKAIVMGFVRTMFDRDTAPGPEPEDLLVCDVPAYIVPGNDASHSTAAARYLHECLPKSEYWDVQPDAQTEAATNERMIAFLKTAVK